MSQPLWTPEGMEIIVWIQERLLRSCRLLHKTRFKLLDGDCPNSEGPDSAGPFWFYGEALNSYFATPITPHASLAPALPVGRVSNMYLVLSPFDLLNSRAYFIQNTANVAEDISVRNPKEPDSETFYILLPSAVVFLGGFSKVTFTVYLNGELQFWAVEIYDVLIDAVLSTEFVPEHLAAR